MGHATNRLAMFVCLAFAQASMAQGVMTFFWEVGDTGDNDAVLAPGESAVLTMYAMWDPREIGYAGSIFDIAGNADWAEGTITNRENLIDSLGTGPGTLNDDNSITGIESFQLPPLFNPQFQNDHPLAIYRFEWTPDEYGVFLVEFSSENHLNASVYTHEFGASVEYDIVITGGTLVVVPAPGAGVVLGAWALGATRRRR